MFGVSDLANVCVDCARSQMDFPFHCPRVL
jgi:hypothetical protein